MIKKMIIYIWEELPFFYLILGILSMTNFILTELKTPHLLIGVLFPLFWIILYGTIKLTEEC